MAFSPLTIIVAIVIRLPALYVALSRGHVRVESSTVVALAIFSAFLGVLMPAAGFDLIGMIFRLALFAVIVMVLTRRSVGGSFAVVLVASVIETVIIFVISISPLNFLVAGMGMFSIP